MVKELKNIVPFNSNFNMDHDPEPLLGAEPSVILSNREKRPFITSFVVSDNDLPRIHSAPPAPALPQKHDNFENNDTSNASTHRITAEDSIASSTRDTIVVVVTLTIIIFTLIVTYFLWKKRRGGLSNSHCNRLEEYRYSRLSQNDVEVDNISFQGDLTHKSLVNAVSVCVDDDDEDEKMKPATLCLEYDSLITISNEEKGESQNKSMTSQSSTKSDAAPMSTLIDDMSDEDLLQ